MARSCSRIRLLLSQALSAASAGSERAVGSAGLRLLQQQLQPGQQRLFHSGGLSKLPSASSWQRWAGLGFAAAGAAGAAAAISTGAAGCATATATRQEEKVKVNGQFTVAASGGAKVRHNIVFVLGGPGSGKGTQCARLVEEFDMAHLSAGDLLREHVKSGTPDGNMVAEMIRNGQIVPAEVTIGLLQDAMAKSGKQRILIDGFPRNTDNRNTFLRMVGYDADLVLFFDCPEDVLEKRLLGRNQGRSDDNIETIKKRFKVFVEQSMPVVAEYEKIGKVKKINTNRPVEEIYKEVCKYVAAI